MLILVAVTINLAADGGLFEKARTASKDTEQKKILEELIAMAEFNNDGKIDVDSLKAKVIGKYEGSSYDETNSKLTVKGNKGEFNYKVTDTEIKLWGENDNPDTKTLSGLYCSNKNCTDTTHLHKGDYVSYKPSKAEGYKPDGDTAGTYTGYKEENQEISQEELEWRVLGKNENGEILLISSTPTIQELNFSSYIAYNNYENLLNDTCKALYSNKDIGTIARSINMKDIDTYLGGNNYNKTEWKSGVGYYGETKTLSVNFDFDNDKKIIKQITEGTKKELTFTNDTYNYEINTYILDTENKDLLCANGSQVYGIADKAVEIESNGNEITYIDFNMGSVENGDIGIYDHYCCYSVNYPDEFFTNENSWSYSLRPIVVLPASVTTKDVAKI